MSLYPSTMVSFESAATSLHLWQCGHDTARYKKRWQLITYVYIQYPSPQGISVSANDSFHRNMELGIGGTWRRAMGKQQSVNGSVNVTNVGYRCGYAVSHLCLTSMRSPEWTYRSILTSTPSTCICHIKLKGDCHYGVPCYAEYLSPLYSLRFRDSLLYRQ
jgi:hypothetical protein